MDGPVARCRGEILLREAFFAVCRRIKGRNILAGDFFGLVPLDLLGTGIPRLDSTLGVEGENRVLFDRVDQPGELLAVGNFADRRARRCCRLLRNLPPDTCTCTDFLRV